nr:unnamed protein product [Digitaria exilis]
MTSLEAGWSTANNRAIDVRRREKIPEQIDQGYPRDRVFLLVYYRPARRVWILCVPVSSPLSAVASPNARPLREPAPSCEVIDQLPVRPELSGYPSRPGPHLGVAHHGTRRLAGFGPESRGKLEKGRRRRARCSVLVRGITKRGRAPPATEEALLPLSFSRPAET